MENSSMTKKNAKTQLRSICPACFNHQALRHGRMVQHGYTRPDGYYANIGTCHGTGKAHFGTPEGRDEAASISAGLKRNAKSVTATAAKVRAGDAETTVYGSKHEGGRFITVAIPAPTSSEREAYARQLDYEAKSCIEAAKEYDARVAAWEPLEPVEVPVEERKATVHFRAYTYSKSGHKACAASAMGAMRGYALMTEKTAEVTCERCKQRRPYLAAVAEGK